MKEQTKYKLSFLGVMCLFGILGPIIRAIGFPSSVTACLRAWIAGISLLIYFKISGTKIDKAEIKKYIAPLLFCGMCMAGDWIFLFEAYNYTTVATATVCYYMQPVIVMIFTPLLLKEKLDTKHIICILVAFVGVALVSGIVENGLPKLSEFTGVLLALAGAMFYAAIVLFNKKYMPDFNPMTRTTGQLLIAGCTALPYVLLTEDLSELIVTPKAVLLLLFLGICMTACTYIVYFGNIVRIPAKTAAIFSYGDPTVAVLVSVLFLHEPISIYGIAGAVLIIGAAMVAEIEK